MNADRPPLAPKARARDTPYVIGNGNTDNYPLMEPFEIPEHEIPDEAQESPSWIILPLLLIATLLILICKQRLPKATSN